ncbi:lysylphosphatidylglycerol synthase transmembrane domain-containing protein [Mesonia aquimarina]|uniref:lysylphosphatidylglycerol synthase transmembrane domain-containing protein n=1 Tax=Mesonia aquimarina TaxID=1504967 RepID=UPI000EF5F598|nr:lysylphosphatidylglycerol synthase transmembrane domain-containing protein [Mesonia aquimarina]
MQKKKRIKLLKIILPLALGVFLIFYSVQSASPEERQALFNNILDADPFWIFLSLACGILSHLSRAYRWKFLLEPLGYKLGFANSFMAVMAAYLANLGIPRSGEVLRGASIATYENIPFEKSFGTIISERVADLVMLLLILGITLIFQAETILPYFQKHNINPFFTLILLFILVVLGVFFIKILQRSTHPFLVRIKNFAKGILEGMNSILHMKKNKPFIFHTIFIWLMYILMFYLAKFSVTGTASLEIGAVLVAFVVGSFAISITNGGIGIYPIAIGAVLLLFGIPKEDGEAFGWVVWGTQTLLNLVIGGLSMFFLPILNQKK